MKETEVYVRRFERGASALYFFSFLESCGYSIHTKNTTSYNVRLGNVGRYSVMTRAEVMKLVDNLRKKRGLEPFSNK